VRRLAATAADDRVLAHSTWWRGITTDGTPTGGSFSGWIFLRCRPRSTTKLSTGSFCCLRPRGSWAIRAFGTGTWPIHAFGRWAGRAVCVPRLETHSVPPFVADGERWFLWPFNVVGRCHAGAACWGRHRPLHQIFPSPAAATRPRGGLPEGLIASAVRSAYGRAG